MTAHDKPVPDSHNTPMEVRRATAADVPAVLPMVSQLCALHREWDAAKYGYHADPASKYRYWLTARAADERSVFLVADRGETAADTLAGFIVGAIEPEIPIYELKEYGFIHDLWVDPAYRHEGVARQLTLRAVEAFKALGVRQIRLETASSNDIARSLFATCGFRPDSIEMLLEI